MMLYIFSASALVLSIFGYFFVHSCSFFYSLFFGLCQQQPFQCKIRHFQQVHPILCSLLKPRFLQLHLCNNHSHNNSTETKSFHKKKFTRLSLKMFGDQIVSKNQFLPIVNGFLISLVDVLIVFLVREDINFRANDIFT